MLYAFKIGAKLHGVDFFGQTGNFAGGVFLMNQALRSRFGNSGNGSLQGFCGIFLIFAFNARNDRFDLCF